MNKFIVTSILALSFAAGASSNTTSEKKLKGALVLRIDKRDQSAALLSTEQKIESKIAAQELAKNSKFAALPKNKIQRKELDQETGSSSWFWYYGTNYNYLNWYGQYYQPAYTYSYGYYNYYYYTGWNWGWNNNYSGCWNSCWHY